MHDGIYVVLDKWELKEGQDKYAFMERCVNDPEISKVLIMSMNSLSMLNWKTMAVILFLWSKLILMKGKSHYVIRSGFLITKSIVFTASI